MLAATWPALMGVVVHGQVEAPLPAAAETQFSVERGFHEEPFVVEITTATEGAEIHYTTNGAEPGNVFTGKRYNGEGIRIETTTVVRAQARKAGHEPSDIVTHSYIFPHHVVEQPDDPEGFSAAWQGSDYGMDGDPAHLPLIAGDSGLSVAAAKEVIAESLLALPSLSLVMPHGELFGASRGIYHHPEGRGREWERFVSVELLHPDGTRGFQVDAGIRMQGFTSRNPARNPKHSLRLVFRGEYGEAKLDYPLFGPAAATRFDTLVLRSNSQDAWVYDAPGNRVGQFVRDEWARRTQLALGRPAPRGTWVHLYLNGLYWGVYNPTERPDASFMESYFGGEKEDYDILKNHEEVIDGTGEAYLQALALIQNDPSRFAAGYLDLSDAAAYDAAAGYVDVPNLIDYLIPNMFAAATDWPGNNYIGRDRKAGSDGFKFFSWDNEHGMKHAVTENRTLPHGRDADSPTKFHHALAANGRYRMFFADRLHRAFFNGGPLHVDARRPGWDPAHPERNRPAALWMELTSGIEAALVAESARWGDYRRAAPYTVAGDFLPLRQELLENWFPRRSAIVLDQFRDRGLYPKLHAPEFSLHGGSVEEGDLLTMQSKSVSVFLPGARILHTLDGTDPRLPNGEVDPAARVYASGVRLVGSSTVKARVESGGEWSALQETLFLVGEEAPSADNLLVSAIHYHPEAPGSDEVAAGHVDGADFEYMELLNVAERPVSLRGLNLVGGIRFDFSEATAKTIAAGERVRLVSHVEAYHRRFGVAASVLGRYRGSLANEGESFAIVGEKGELILGVTYDDEHPWPSAADGNGFALVVTMPGPGMDLSDPGNWSAQPADGGPGLRPWEQWWEDRGVIDGSATFPGTDVNHLAAYYFGMDLSGERFPDLRIERVGDDSDLALVIRRRATGLDGLGLTVEGSDDLIEWREVFPTGSAVLPELGEPLQRVRLTLDRDQGHRYHRLRIAAP